MEKFCSNTFGVYMMAKGKAGIKKLFTMQTTQETEFYSKVYVARSLKFAVDEASKGNINLSVSDKFSHNLATILARDKEVVAVNLKILNDKCKIYISKNSDWTNNDRRYIDKIKGVITDISKAAPLTLKQTSERADAGSIFYYVLEYCSVKFGTRLRKLQNDIRHNKDELYIKSFLEFAHFTVDNLEEKEPYFISSVCCKYYTQYKDLSTIPERILGHIKKVGSYFGSVMDIINCARKEQYKASFGCIDLHLLEPISNLDQVVHSWYETMEDFIPVQKDLNNFKRKCLKNHETKRELETVYGGTCNELFQAKKSRMCLHAELNVLAKIMDQAKGNTEFIAVSKRCCYLCELYIKFIQSKGYNIAISGTHKKLYHLWKLPEAFKDEFMEHALLDLHRIIELGIEQHSGIIVKSDSEGDRLGSDIDTERDSYEDAVESFGKTVIHLRTNQ